MPPPASPHDHSPGPGLPSHELFELLGNATRIKILEALWVDFNFEHYVIERQDGLAFSDLRANADVPDSGNFNYHLDKLTGDLIDQRDDGYVLTPLGYNLMHAITTYEAFEYQTIPATDLDHACPFCGSTLQADYTRELVSTYCEQCGGLADGNISVVHLPLNEIADTDLHRILDAATLQLQHRTEAVRYGHCGRCHADITPHITVCTDHSHDPNGLCPNCIARFQAEIRVDCDACGAAGAGPFVELAITDPHVTAFFTARNTGPHDTSPFQYRLNCLASVTETIIDPDAPTVSYTFTTQGDAVTIELHNADTGITINPT